MKGVFVDTSAWVAIKDQAERHHDAVVRARNEALRGGSLLVTTDYVADETLTLLRRRFGIDCASEWWEEISHSSRARLEHVDPDRFARARRLFFSQRDKGYSFTDCTSQVVMKELKLADVLTTDHHFDQMGFRVLPPANARRR